MTGLSDLLQHLNTEGWSSRRIERETERHGHKISFATVSRYLAGTHPSNPDAATLQAFADVFGAPVNDLRAALGRPGVGEPFDLGPEATRLTGPQRDVIRTTVRLFVEQNDALAGGPVADGATSESEDIYGLAALDRPSRGKAMKRAANELGEGSQDPGNDEPA